MLLVISPEKNHLYNLFLNQKLVQITEQKAHSNIGKKNHRTSHEQENFFALKPDKSHYILFLMTTDYKKALRDYPDVVTIGQLCKMIRISDGTARKLVQQDLIPHFYIRTTYYIPKQNVIDYLNSDHYKQYRLKLKNSI